MTSTTEDSMWVKKLGAVKVISKAAAIFSVFGTEQKSS
jgi:hypothetical protein